MSPTHSADAATSALPEGFAEIADDFHALGGKDRLQLLLEFSQGLPELPERYSEHPELLEPVPECQSPIFLATEVEGQGREATAHLFFSAPPEAPTTRGFAAILAEALDGRSVGEVLDTPDTVTGELGLAEVVSPLRLNGMSGMLARIKRQLSEKAGV
ncbi:MULTISPECIES: SufE family protein [Brachybacterium]|uniref:SufE family protein n=2 Tax=Brachybacterium TaxID=43668 RepID=A0A426SIK6_9MICO|nr:MULTISPECIES: SufE family protein [Brachybacterium]MCT1437202.1 SufE family protein [Brachybacterium paraconglomeratum]RRR17993.1 SufE family protein [Brachybacterium paraconglomeratum]GAP78939.1 sulfur acceptor protein SufE [Brachybacterium sp. SW0106-09]GLI29252.1 cysteine desufuration protein SufE [Brachybacterium conglomeratum]GLK05582.1 cysteine desulfurization protein SufE [Brachybacterium conglomeratum]